MIAKNQPSLKITRLARLNTLILKQSENSTFFISSQNGIVIGIPSLLFIIRFLILNNIIDYRTLEGILEEYHSS
jgi:hypothetical protein